jgi:nicotinamidase-related amidase
MGGRLTAGTQFALIVVDLVYGFTDPEFPAGSRLDAVVESTRRLLDVARAAGFPVIFTTIVFPEGLPGNPVWVQKMPALHGLRPNSRWIEVDRRLEPRADELCLQKQAASAFTGTLLAATLTTLRVDSLIVCGATTSGCVRSTVVDACMAGWPTFLPRECVGDRSAAAHDASLIDIDAKYGDVVTSEAASALLINRRGPAS